MQFTFSRYNRSMLKLLFIGDVCGKPGRETVRKVLPGIKAKHAPDLVIANVENSAGGFGVSRETVEELVNAGIDFCTSGDHTFAMSEFLESGMDDLPFIRPANYEAPGLPGKGVDFIDLRAKGRVAIINLLGQELFTHTQRVRSPFWFVDEMLEQSEIKESDLVFIDFHAEATSEKLALAWYVRDRVQAVVGSHTHVATADNRLLGGKIAYVTDAGQVGPYDASLWVDFENVIHNFKYPYRKPMKMAETGPRIFNSVLFTFDREIGKKYSPIAIERVDAVVE